MFKKLFLIIIILIAAIVALLAVLWLTKSKPTVQPPQAEEPIVQPSLSPEKPEPKPPPATALQPALDNSFLEFGGKKVAPASDQSREQSQAREFVRFYIANFGSYSANNFEHLANLKYLSSAKVENYLDNFISQEREKLANRPAYSITAQALDISFDSFDSAAGFAKASVLVLRIENEPLFYTNRSFEQTADIWLSKVDGNWQTVRVEWRE